MTRIPNLEALIVAENINSSIIDLDNYISELCEHGDNYNELTEPQKLFYFNQNLEKEVNNGGFHQYFINSSGDNAHETVLSLKEIGANKTANILLQAIQQFPDKKVPKEQSKRLNIVEQIINEASEVWQDLDEEFFKYEEDLNKLHMEFVKKKQDYF